MQAGISPLLEFAALISINLGIFNLLPIPGLDGGRLVFVLLEWVRRGKRISPQKEGLVHMIGFVAMILLILVISYFDVARIIRGESLLP
jgi:regulator of sigma E protease